MANIIGSHLHCTGELHNVVCRRKSLLLNGNFCFVSCSAETPKQVSRALREFARLYR
jgi:hypothetical protein